MLVNDSVHIWRAPEGAYQVRWEISSFDTQVRVGLLKQAGGYAVDYGRDDVVESDVKGTYSKSAVITGLPLSRRHRFLVRDNYGNECALSERNLGLQGTPNFRDFGGYLTKTGQRVRWGCLFRSGQLSELTEADVELISSLELGVICDLRRTDEQASEPHRLPKNNLSRIVSLPITPGSRASFFEQASKGTPADMQRYMALVNRDFVESQNAVYTQVFEELLAESEAAFLVNCAAGKDRTGFAAAIILMALGVPRETIMADYLLTAQFLSPSWEMERILRKYDLKIKKETLYPLLEVHESYLQQAFTAIDELYGSTKTYLASALGVGEAECAQLQARYLL